MNHPKRIAWLILILSAVFVLYQFLLQSSTSVMIPQLMCDFSISISSVGVLSASFFYPYLLLQIPSGLLVDRFGARRVLLSAILLCGLASLGFALAPNHWCALLARLLMGVASAPAVVCAMCLSCRWFPKAWFAVLAGIIESVGMLGGAVGEYSLSHAVAHFGWRGTMVLCAIAALVLYLLCLAFVRNKPSQQVSDHCETSKLPLTQSLMQLIRQPQLWINCLYAGFLFSVITAFAGLWAIPFLQSDYNLSASTAAAASALVFIGTAIGAPLSGFIASRFGRIKFVMFSCALLCALSFEVLVYSPPKSWLLVIALLLAIGLTSGGYVLAFTQVEALSTEQNRGCAMGLTNMMCIALGAPLLQPIIGWLLSSGLASCHRLLPSDYQYGLSPLFVSLLLAVMMALLVRSTSR